MFVTVLRKFSLSAPALESTYELEKREQVAQVFDSLDWTKEIEFMKQAVLNGKEEFVPPAFLVWNKFNDFELYISSFDLGVFEIQFTKPIDEHEVEEFVSNNACQADVYEVIAAFGEGLSSKICRVIAQANTPNGELYHFLKRKADEKKHYWYYSSTGYRVFGIYFGIALTLGLLAKEHFYSQSNFKWFIWGGTAIFIFVFLAIAEKIKNNKT